MTTESDGPGSHPRGGGSGFDWKVYAELLASMQAALQATERRIVERIDANAAQVGDLERRLRDAEQSVTQVKTVGALLMALTTFISLGLTIAGFVLSHGRGG